MKLITFLTFFLLVLQNALAQNSNPSGNKIYRFNEVMRIEIAMAESHKQELLDDIDLFSDEYFPANIKILNSKIDTTLANVGVRLRGNTSRNNDKKSIKISFTAYEGEKFYNHKKFNLKAETNDPSLLREYLSLHLYRNYGVPAARAHFVELYINNEYLGVYLNVEQIDDEFVDRRFEDNEAGNLYKCLYPSTLENNGELDNNSLYDLKTNKATNDRSGLKEFAAILDNPQSTEFKSDLEAVFNVDNYLMQLATEALIGHWDSYTRNNNNYYLYEDEASMKIHYIPYDVDNTWGIDWGFVNWGTESVTEWISSSNSTIPLAKNITNISDYYDQYCRHIVTQIDNFFNEEYMFPIIDSVNKMLSPYVKRDTYYTLDNGYTHNDFMESTDMAWGNHVYYGLKEYLSYRQSDASSDLNSYTSYGEVQAIDPLEPIYYIPNNNTATNSTLGKQFKVYPNPVTNGIFSVTLDEEYAVSTIKLYDTFGREIDLSVTDLSTNVSHVSLNEPLNPGLYFLKVGTQLQTIIIQ